MRFAHHARQGGVDIREHTGAHSLNLSPDGTRIESVTAVVRGGSNGGGGGGEGEAQGDHHHVISCDHVVVAAGQWTSQLCSGVGVPVPTATCPHQYVVFDQIKHTANEGAGGATVAEPYVWRGDGCKMNEPPVLCVCAVCGVCTHLYGTLPSN